MDRIRDTVGLPPEFRFPNPKSFGGHEFRVFWQQQPGTGLASRRSLAGKQSLTLGVFARELAGAPDAFGFLAGFFLGWLFVMITKLHFPEDAFPLHLFLKGLESLVDIIVADENLHAFDS